MERGIILAALVGLLVTSGIALILDGRQRRMNKRLAAIMPTVAPADAPAFARVRQGGGYGSSSIRGLAYKLFKYDPRAVYMWPASVTVLGGMAFAALVIYGGLFADFTIQTIMIAAAITAWLIIRGLFGWQQRRYVNRLFRQLPDVVELVTSTVSAGLPVSEAFRIVAREMPEPSATQFALVCDDLSFGKSPEDAIDGIYLRTRIAEYGMFAVTLAVQMKSGGRLSETLRTLGETVRQRVALAARAKALAGEVIFSSKALIVSPVIIGGLLYLVNHQLVDLLFLDPRGRFMLAIAVTSTCIGAAIIQWMVKKETTV